MISVLCNFLEFARAGFVVSVVNDGVGREGDDVFVLREGEEEEGVRGREREERKEERKEKTHDLRA